MRRLIALTAIGALLLLQACASESGDAEEAETGPEADMGVESPTPLPMPEPGVWETVRPGGETLCSRGSEYRFYFRGGDPSKVMVYFQVAGRVGTTSLARLQMPSLAIE